MAQSGTFVALKLFDQNVEIIFKATPKHAVGREMSSILGSKTSFCTQIAAEGASVALIDMPSY